MSREWEVGGVIIPLATLSLLLNFLCLVTVHSFFLPPHGYLFPIQSSYL